MRLSKALMASVLLAALGCGGAEMRSVAFMTAVHCDRPPALDGTLDDPAWQTSPPCRLFYEYYKPQPGPGKLKTEMRLLYDDKGVYLGVTNFDEKMDGVKAVYTTRDADNLWQDDCNEIYFDSFGQGIGYAKFVVNSIGTMGDSRRIDAAVSLPEWNGSGWQVKAVKRGDAWTYEAFFPWQDLGKKAEPGDLWRFCLVRYAYSSGGFIGVTSSPGGNYGNPNNFGVLVFSAGAKLDPADIAKSIEGVVAPPWFLPLDAGLLECAASGASQFLAIKEIIGREEKQRGILAAEVLRIAEAGKANPDIGKMYEEFQRQLKTAPSASDAADPAEVYMVYSEQAKLRTTLADLYWRIKVLDLVERQ